jgi:hypothetical protein
MKANKEYNHHKRSRVRIPAGAPGFCIGLIVGWLFCLLWVGCFGWVGCESMFRVLYGF